MKVKNKKNDFYIIPLNIIFVQLHKSVHIVNSISKKSIVLEEKIKISKQAIFADKNFNRVLRTEVAFILQLSGL